MTTTTPPDGFFLLPDCARVEVGDQHLHLPDNDSDWVRVPDQDHVDIAANRTVGEAKHINGTTNRIMAPTRVIPPSTTAPTMTIAATPVIQVSILN